MTEILTVEGPLEHARLRWVADLYGRADPKYLRDDVLQHLFTQSPAGAALHSFAVDEDRPVGHCAVVPTRARRGSDELRCGKLEALWVEESYRRGNVARSLLDELYALADQRGFELVHGHATALIGQVIRFLPLDGVGKRSWVGVASPDAVASRTIAGAQRAIGTVASVFARSPDAAALRAATTDDADLVAVPPPPPDRWAAVVDDSWDWYRSSPLVRVLELPGPHGFRALVQVPAAPREPVRIVGWRARRAGLRPAILLLRAAGRLARELRAPTLRFQPWASEAGDGTLERACRLLGFVPRADQTTLWVRTHDPALARPKAVVSTPLLYLAF